MLNLAVPHDEVVDKHEEPGLHKKNAEFLYLMHVISLSFQKQEAKFGAEIRQKSESCVLAIALKRGFKDDLVV